MSIPRIASYPLSDLSALGACQTSSQVAWQPVPSRSALLIHDMQEYFLNFYDRSAAPIPQLIDHIITLRDYCTKAGIPIVYTAQPPQQSLQQRGLLQDWWGPGITAKPEQAAIVEALKPQPQDLILTKWRYSAFQQSELQELMQSWNRDQLLICGIYAHIGCMATAVDAFMRDIQPFFIADALADFSLADHDMALRWVSQRCGVACSTDWIIEHLNPVMPIPDTEQSLLLTLSRLLELPPDELQADDDLLLVGLDSIRLMNLVAGWQAAGLCIEFNDLAERPTVGEWWDLIQTRQTV